MHGATFGARSRERSCSHAGKHRQISEATTQARLPTTSSGASRSMGTGARRKFVAISRPCLCGSVSINECPKDLAQYSVTRHDGADERDTIAREGAFQDRSVGADHATLFSRPR